jgi:Uma2 family endonuclease
MLFTAADLELLPRELASREVDDELDEGRLVLIDFPFTVAHATATTNILFQLWLQCERTGHGKVRGRVGIVLTRKPDTVLAPDVAFFANTSFPIRQSSEGYLETIPELVVEIVDRKDSVSHLPRKVANYLQSGVATVWVANWTTRTVTAHTCAGEPTVYNESDRLSLPTLTAEFSMPVADVFRE